MFTFERKPRPYTARTPAPKLTAPRPTQAPPGNPLWFSLAKSSYAGAAASEAASSLPVASGRQFDVTRIPLMPPSIQRKATVSSPGDPFEREADEVADEVMRMAEPADIGSAPAAIQRKCAACEDEENNTLQAKRALSAYPGAELDTGAAVRVAERGGEPLPGALRSYFEPRFGCDFSRVRLHTDTEAMKAASGVEAQAYTVGRNIVFGAGAYAPTTAAGRRLLAHELTHVVQQRGGGTSVQRRVIDPAELEAEKKRKEATRRIECAQNPAQCDPGGALDALGSLPSAAAVADNRPRLLSADKPLFESLVELLAGLLPRIDTLLANPPASAPWLTRDNDNVAIIRSTLNSLVNDMRGLRFAIRFDSQLQGALGEYDPSENLMRLRPFTNDQERTSVAQTLLHEYTHFQQDKRAEAVFATHKQASEDTAADVTRREVEGRRVQVYFSQILSNLGIGEPDFNRALTNAHFFGVFEKERAGTPAEQKQASADITAEIGAAYAQNHTSYPRGQYVVEIDQKNHAVLYAGRESGAAPVDLTDVPADVALLPQLLDHIERAFRTSKLFPSLVMSTTGQRYPVILLTIIHGGAVVGQRYIVSP